jgi:hypothetical protein
MGVIGARKTRDRGKMVACFVMGFAACWTS